MSNWPHWLPAPKKKASLINEDSRNICEKLLCARQSPAVLLPVEKKLLHTLLVLILWNGMDGKKMEESWEGGRSQCRRIFFLQSLQWRKERPF